ncbi:hypothetical protein STCU_07464 [Strigomonas culicis]|uniref:SAM-dependent methyltransferase RsmB-F/NOP2-type catalytic core domain-containing protein n=1 Tax=Strigomonas culicis TaxID=28005 RepID=S9V9W4_9TRYP|nr:hypothetical protein STCU_07464 [Strigomonas culicis]|eukprot:EPY23776.1 hypothetical protein STCU_07464 [Strigomonas culicis]
MLRDEACASYPATFSEALVAHCINGFVPPQVFRDIAQAAHAAGRQPRRFVRLHPQAVSRAMQEARVPRDALTGHLQRLVADSFRIAADAVEPLAWLPCYAFSVVQSLPLHTNPLYQQGLLIGMDAASMAAVVALRPAQGDCCLDMCCAPAMKLSLIADAVTSGGGVAVGVDVSIDRLFAARTVVQRHQQAWGGGRAACAVALFAADGRRFALRAAAARLDPCEAAPLGAKGVTTWEGRALRRAHLRAGGTAEAAAGLGAPKRSRDGAEPAPAAPQQGDAACWTNVVYASAAARAQLRGALAASPSSDAADYLLFDRVLVDAECSHDGSLSHVSFTDAHAASEGAGESTSRTDSKGIRNAHRMARINLHGDPAPPAADACQQVGTAGGEGWESTWLDRSFLALSPLAQLQLALLCRGYDTLKVGGTLVYSTCSFSFRQNEYILLCFLEKVNGGRREGAARATACPAFVYPLPPSDDPKDEVKPFLQHASPEALQARLNRHWNDYSILEKGLRAVTDSSERAEALLADAQKGLLGSRFWPLEFGTSFQYIAKIRKVAEESV